MEESSVLIVNRADTEVPAGNIVPEAAVAKTTPLLWVKPTDSPLY
jgi:hypothetical protein